MEQASQMTKARRIFRRASAYSGSYARLGVPDATPRKPPQTNQTKSKHCQRFRLGDLGEVDSCDNAIEGRRGCARTLNACTCSAGQIINASSRGRIERHVIERNRGGKISQSIKGAAARRCDGLTVYCPLVYRTVANDKSGNGVKRRCARRQLNSCTASYRGAYGEHHGGVGASNGGIG